MVKKYNKLTKEIRNIKVKFCLLVLFFWALTFFGSCKTETGRETKSLSSDLKKFKLVAEIKSNPKSPFYINFIDYPLQRDSLPIGIFDSGTGGLTVLNAVIKMDRFDNQTHEKGSDGIPDFIAEKFIYLGDRANMPYGRYPREGKTDFLQELIIKDVWFLLSDKYFLSPKEKMPAGEKQPVKAIVIACNTATAYGYELAQEVIQEWDLDLKTVGIIDAGAKQAVRSYDPKENDFIGVFATEGTCDSKGYVKALKKHFRERSDPLRVVQQPCFGLAGAVDGDRAYMAPDQTRARGPEIYQGPRLGHPIYPIDLTLWDEYNFEKGNSLLVENDIDGKVTKVEINSINNYIKYYVTSLVEKARKEKAGSIHSVILGCTHYPLFKQEFRDHFLYLRSLNDKYKKTIPENLLIIDPAEAEAESLYLYLNEKDLFAQNSNQESRFFLSFPNPRFKGNRVNSNGEFPLSYKYGRFINRSSLYVKRIPLIPDMISADLKTSLKRNIPDVYGLLFNQDQ
jgi:glutamate racemase